MNDDNPNSSDPTSDAAIPATPAPAADDKIAATTPPKTFLGQAAVTYQISKLDQPGRSYVATTREGELALDHTELSVLLGGKKGVDLCASVNALAKTHAIVVDRNGKLIDREKLVSELRATAKPAKAFKTYKCQCGTAVAKGAPVLFHKTAGVVGCDDCATVEVIEETRVSVGEQDGPFRVVLRGDYLDCNENVEATRKALRARYIDSKEGGKLGMLYVIGEEPGKPGRLHYLRKIQNVVGGDSITDANSLYLLMKNLDFGAYVADEETGRQQFKPQAPPIKIAHHILRMGNQYLPRLKGLVRLPTLTASGAILTEQGYDEKSELFSDPMVKIEPVAEVVSSRDVAEAKAILDDLLFDFPFRHDGARAAAVALMLEQCVRHALIDGPCPCYVNCAPDPKTGKSLLAEVQQIALQGAFKPTAWTNDSKELDKRLLPMILEADPLIVFDNVKDVVDSAQFAMALTSPIYVGRWLGESRIVAAPNKSSFVMTSNNASFVAEMSRRMVMVDLDERMRSTPNGPNGLLYRHADIREYAKKNRPRIIRALLVLAKGWLQAGSPRDPKLVDLPSFERWSRVIGGILHFSGYREFSQAVYAAQEERNSERDVAADVLRAIFRAHALTAIKTTDIGLAVIEAGVAEAFDYKGGFTKNLNPLTVGKKVIKTFLSELKRWPVRIDGREMQLVERGTDGHGSKLFGLEVVESELKAVSVVDTGDLAVDTDNIIDARSTADYVPSDYNLGHPTDPRASDDAVGT